MKNKKSVYVFLSLFVLFLLNLNFALGYSQEFNEETEIGEMFGLPKENVVVKNVILNIEEGINFIINDFGYIKIKTMEKSGTKEREINYIYENILSGELSVNVQAIPISANFESKGNFEYLFPRNNPIDLTSPARIIFKDGIVQLINSQNNPLSLKLNYFGKEYILNSESPTYFSGDIVFGEEFNIGELKISSGKVQLTDSGYLLREGQAEYKKIFTGFIGNTIDPILIANPEVDINDCKINCLKIADKTLEALSAQKNNFLLQILPGNEIFNSNKYNYEDGIKTRIADENDFLRITLYDGAGFKAENREQENLVPLVEQTREEGGISFSNGRNYINLDKEGFKIAASPLFRGEEKAEGGFHLIELRKESIALKISSLTKGKLIINSANQFKLMKDNKEIMNSFPGGEINENFDDNMVQTIEDLKGRWPETKFIYPCCDLNKLAEKYDERLKEENISIDKILIEFIFDRFLPTEDIENKKAYVSPTEIQAIDQWIKKNGNPIEGLAFSFVELDNLIGAGPAYQVFLPDFFNEGKETRSAVAIRTGTLDYHSFSKYLSYLKDRDFYPLSIIDHEYTHAELRKIEESDIKKFKEEIDTEIKNYISQLRGEDRGISLYLEILEERKEAVIYEKKHAKDIVLSEEQYTWFIEKRDEELKALEEEINVLKRIKRDGEYDSLPAESMAKINDRITTLAEWERSKIIDKIAASKTSMDTPIGTILNKIVQDKKDNLINSWEYKEFLKEITKNPLLKEIKDPFELGNTLDIFTERDPSLYLSLNNRFRKIYDEKIGAPAYYSLLFKAGTELDAFRLNYPEILTTLIEEGPEEWQRKIEYGTEMQKLTYKELIQVSFDLGLIKMPPEDYQRVLGVKCETPDCMEYRCIKYLASCCKNFPNAPNCLIKRGIS